MASGNIGFEETFWELAKFRYPTHQISFHSARSLDHITFEGSYEINDR